MRILHLISSEGFYGAETVVVLLARALESAGCECVIGVFRDARAAHMEVAEEARARGLRVEEIPCAGRVDATAVRAIRGAIARYRPDVVHAHGYKSDVYAFAAARGSRTTLVSTCHGQIRNRLSLRAYAALDWAILRRFDRVAAVSDELAAVLVSAGLDPSRVISIPNGLDPGRFARARPLLRDDFGGASAKVVGMIARLDQGKGADVLLRAAPRVLIDFPETKFVFVGDGPQRSMLEALAARLNITANVIFAGVRRDMPSVYASIDVVTLPSLNEGMPMCLLEAMAAARPVVATSVGSIPTLIVPHRTGLLAAPGEPLDLGSKISQALSRPGEARLWGENAKAQVADRYSAAAMAKKYACLYDEARIGRVRADGWWRHAGACRQ